MKSQRNQQPRIIVAVSSIVLVLSAFVAGAGTESSTILRQLLGDALNISRKKVTAIEYCPDNTCEVFRIRTKGTQQALADFAFLYLYHVSDYEVLSEFREMPKAKESAKLIRTEKRGKKCEGFREGQAVKCILRELAARHSISLGLVRYDERARIEEPMDLETELARIN